MCHQFVLDGPQEYHHLACRAINITSAQSFSTTKSDTRRHNKLWMRKRWFAYRVGAVSCLYAAAVEEKSDGVGSLALSLAEGVHQLLQGGGALDFEEDLIVVVGNLDVEMFGLAGALWLLGGTWATILIRARHLSWRWVKSVRVCRVRAWGYCGVSVK